MTRNRKKRWIQHYNSSQKILLVGEGDFSFSACLARTFGSATNMVATSLHSKATLIKMHWSSQEHLETLERSGCLVLHKVDVYKMSRHPALKHVKFDVIIFNFPHAGHYSFLRERDPELIQMHRELLMGFFKNARKMLCKDGEVHVTHRDDYPYNTWEVEKLAEGAGLHLKQKAEFRKKDYPGYHNKRGSNINCNKTFPLKQCYTFKFTLQEESNSQKINDNDDQSNGSINDDMSGISAAIDILHV